MTRHALDIGDEVRWAVLHRKGKTLQDLVYKLSLAACMYHIWREKNNGIFENLSLTTSQLVTKIEGDVRTLLSSWRSVKQTDANLL